MGMEAYLMRPQGPQQRALPSSKAVHGNGNGCASAAQEPERPWQWLPERQELRR